MRTAPSPYDNRDRFIPIDSRPCARRESASSRQLVLSSTRQHRPVDAAHEIVPAGLRSRGVEDSAEVLGRIGLQPAVLENLHFRIERPGQPASQIVTVEEGAAQSLGARKPFGAGRKDAVRVVAPGRNPVTSSLIGIRETNTAATSAVTTTARPSMPRADQAVRRAASIGAVARKSSGVKRR